jgi:hypothetical protein
MARPDRVLACRASNAPKQNRESREDAMSTVFFLSNYYDGPLEGQGHGQGPKPGNPGHPWHWLKETNQGWESIPLVAGKTQHFEIAPHAVKHARDHGFEVHYNHPEFKTTFAVKP